MIKNTVLLGKTREELQALAVELGEKPFRGKQLYTWLSRGVTDPDQMTDMPRAFRAKLAGVTGSGGMSVLREQRAKDGTRKFLFGLEDGNAVEGVFMKYHYGASLCISSQVGCRMGCVFCASGMDGLVRNLTAGEMLGQILLAEETAGEKIGHVVIMGTGEPLDNYEELSRFLQILHDPSVKGMSYRNITVSTSGLIPQIRRFGDEFPQVNLAISLHRLTEEGRSALMPVNRAYPLKDLLEAARDHAEKTGRRVTFEYALIKGENDGEEDVRRMEQLLGGMLCHVNLIPLNPVEETGLAGTERKRAEAIAGRLRSRGIPCTVRRELGTEIDGACGQLRLQTIRKNG